MKKVLLLAVVFAIANVASATVIMTEDFAYADGSLTSVSAGVWNRYSGSANNGPLVSSQTAVSGAGADDVRRPYAEQSGDVFFTIDFTVTDVGTDDTYLLGMIDGSTMEGGRYFFGTPAGVGDFDIGVSVDNATADDWVSGISFSLDTTYTMVGQWDGTDTVNLWINPGFGDLASPDATAVETVASANDGFFIRQGGGWDNGDGSVTFDDITVGTTWADVVAIPEPTGIALFGLGLLGLLVYRRRK